MLSKLKDIENNFKVVKNVGGEGEALAKLTTRTIENMITIVNSFEAGLQSTVWTSNLQSTLSEEEQVLIFKVYETLKITLVSLNETAG